MGWLFLVAVLFMIASAGLAGVIHARSRMLAAIYRDELAMEAFATGHHLTTRYVYVPARRRRLNRPALAAIACRPRRTHPVL